MAMMSLIKQSDPSSMPEMSRDSRVHLAQVYMLRSRPRLSNVRIDCCFGLSTSQGCEVGMDLLSGFGRWPVPCVCAIRGNTSAILALG